MKIQVQPEGIVSLLTETMINIFMMVIMFFGGYMSGRARGYRDTAKFIDLHWDYVTEKLRRDAQDFPHRSEWRCEICKEYRIDALISVAKYRDESGIAQMNVKYCNDRANCVARAHDIDTWYGEKVYRIESDERK